ncbi:phosphate signaling complex protein PhoU [Marispirochaeta sp.]|jgi:phosphate transport system protein|uniref:phosphate signaling complex protein PhoU n=1 Tax=Marispirochaeta sp. TaxID=2038653 RepID=UPI0029C8F0A7|nr:phosphate signaling complex protein PhoU [Marispirochaeta sp.]
MPSIRRHFLEELNKLHENLLRMGILVEESIHKSVSALKSQNRELAENIIQDDENINDAETEILDHCIKLLATQQPVAGDLRTIVTAIKVATQLERVGDHSVHIAKSVCKLSDEPFIRKLTDTSRMGEICQAMIRDVLTALINNNGSYAQEVARRDDEVDKLYYKITRELVAFMLEENTRINQGLELLFIARYLERIGDHVTNISELVVYNSSGKHVELNR